MNARRVSLIAALVLALAPASAEASRKLSVASLSVPPTGEPAAPLKISGAVRNRGDERARTTVRAYLVETVGQLRIGGRKVPVGPGRKRKFSMSPALPRGLDEGEYEIEVCVRRVNRKGRTDCRSAPLTVGG